MKNYAKLTLLVLAGTFIGLQSCKKGENDPAISFKSRTERLSGDWKLTNKQGNIVFNYVTPNKDSISTLSSVYNYNGTLGIEQTTQSSNTVGTTTKDYNYTFKISFEKNGNYKYEAVFQRPVGGTNSINQIYKGSGNWNWLDKGKEKVAIRLENEGSIIGLDTLNANTLLPYTISNEYYLDKLSSTEMVWKVFAENFVAIDTISATETQDFTFKFTR